MTSMKSAARGGMVLVGSAALCVSMTACGGKSHHTAKATSKASASASHMKHSKKSGSSKSSCSTAKIGGVNKCLQAGQMCSHKHASDYKSYGFVCSKKNNRYVLNKK